MQDPAQEVQAGSSRASGRTAGAAAELADLILAVGVPSVRGLVAHGRRDVQRARDIDTAQSERLDGSRGLA